jgi:hypothetical protein
VSRHCTGISQPRETANWQIFPSSYFQTRHFKIVPILADLLEDFTYLCKERSWTQLQLCHNSFPGLLAKQSIVWELWQPWQHFTFERFTTNCTVLTVIINLQFPSVLIRSRQMDTAVSYRETQRTRHFSRRFQFIRMAVAS